MADPTPEQLKKQIEDLNKRLQAAGGLGIDFAEAMRKAGNNVDQLNKFLTLLNKQYNELTDNADYVYSTFRDITAELNRQNAALKAGRGAFKEFTDIGQKLSSYQKGYNDLTEKNFKRIKGNLSIEKEELDFAIERLSNAGRYGDNQREIGALRSQALAKLTTQEQQLLKQLEAESQLMGTNNMSQQKQLQLISLRNQASSKLNLTDQIRLTFLEKENDAIDQGNVSYNKQNLLNSLRSKATEDLTKREKALLRELKAEKELLENAIDARKNGIPALDRELHLSEQISKSRKNLGGLAEASGKLVSKYGGSLSSFFNVNEAIEAVEDYNKKLIDGALRSKEVQNAILANEEKRFNLLQKHSELQDQIRDAERELSTITSLQANQIELNNLANDTSLKALGDKKAILNEIGNTIGLDAVKQQEINDLLTDQVNLANEIEQIGIANLNLEQQRQALLDMSNDASLTHVERYEASLKASQLQTQIDNNNVDIQQKQVQFGLAKLETDQKIAAIEPQITAELGKQAKLESEIAALKSKSEKEEKQLAEDLKAIDEDNNKIKEDAIKKTDTLVNKTKALATFTKSVGAGLLKAFTDPLAILTFFIKAALKADQQTVDLGRSMGISRNMASKMREDMVAYSRATGDSFVNTDRLMKAQMGLTEELGLAVDFGGEEQETFARLTELVGLSAKEAGKFAMLSAVTGNTTKDYVANVRKAAMESMRANKIHISDKELLKSISNLSAGILIKFQNNPKALAEAVVQAKKLGLSLEQVDKIGDSMLDWETSIEKELQAELITGKKLNFERARAAALTGDQAALMQEVAAQAGSLEEYQNMNVIAQKSLAEAFGMSREEMSEMLLKQEMINKYGDKANELTTEQLKEMEKRGMTAEQYTAMIQNQQSIQENFNNLMLKFQDIIGNIAAGPLGTMLSMFAEMLSNAEAMKVIILAIATIYGGKMLIGLGKTIAQLGIALGLSTAKAVAEVTAAEALTLGAATIGIVAGLAAVMAAMSSNSKPKETKFAKGGIVTSEINNATIGEAGKEAIIPLESPTGKSIMKDSIAPAATAARTAVANASTNNGEFKAAMSEIKEMARSMKDMANRPSVAVIKGEDPFGRNLGAVLNLGTSQTQNTYQVA